MKCQVTSSASHLTHIDLVNFNACFNSDVTKQLRVIEDSPGTKGIIKNLALADPSAFQMLNKFLCRCDDPSHTPTRFFLLGDVTNSSLLSGDDSRNISVVSPIAPFLVPWQLSAAFSLKKLSSFHLSKRESASQLQSNLSKGPVPPPVQTTEVSYLPPNTLQVTTCPIPVSPCHLHFYTYLILSSSKLFYRGIQKVSLTSPFSA